MYMDNPTLTLTDDVGRSLVCHVEMSAALKGITYALLSPVDYPVDIFAWVSSDDGEDELETVEEGELNDVYATAQAVLAELNLKLNRSALSLTVAGDLPDVDEDEILALELEDGNSIGEPEEYQLLATFFQDDQEYAIYTPLEPVLLVVRLLEDDSPELLTPEEFQVIQPQLQPLFEAQMLDDLE